MKRLITGLMSVSFAAVSVSALDVTVTPGNLKEHITELKTTADSRLVLKGSADARDLALIHQASRSVSELDMSELTIVSCSLSDGAYMGRTEFGDGEIIPYMLAGSGAVTVHLPASTRVVGESAFAGASVRQIDLPASVGRVDDHVFDNCRNLETVTFSSDAVIGKAVFKDCAGLTHVGWSTEPATIPESTFEGCSSYDEPLPGGVKEVGPNAYNGTALTTLNLSSLSKAGDYAFANMSRLSSVEFHEQQSVELGKGVFFNDKALSDMNVWNGTVNELLFSHFGGRFPFVINDPVVHSGAFANCTNIETVVLGRDVETIREHSFRNMTGLRTVDVTELDTTMPDVDAQAFSGLETEDGYYDVYLKVKPATEPIWKEHPVWGLFKVSQTGVVENFTDPNADIAVVMDGGDVVAKSTLPIAELTVYGLNGTILSSLNPGDNECRVSVADEQTLFVVRVVSGGKVKIVKLARN